MASLTGSSKTIIIQLSLALAGLALQFPDWQDTAVQSVIDRFGQNPATVSTLLEFLTVLPEEISSNSKIPVTVRCIYSSDYILIDLAICQPDEYKDGSTRLLTNNAGAIASLLTMYITASGVTTALQSQILYCLRSWVIAGEILPSAVAETPLLGFAFDALESDDLFDAAVDVLCEVIHETQEVDENMAVIEVIIPKLVELKPKLLLAKDDPEKMKGLQKSIAKLAIGECSAYHDLDIVPITFQFWMRHALSIGKRPSVSPLFLDAYRSLMRVMIRHLYFPEDPSKMAPQEADDFRSFRHVMGDTLKDCCFALEEACAGRPVSWQEIEAPLFSLRSMGAEIDPSDDRVIPKITDLMPSLADYPRPTPELYSIPAAVRL
ncbi:Xpo1-domain-containing protein, partial [Fomitiporia mediterranea MF3/22]